MQCSYDATGTGYIFRAALLIATTAQLRDPELLDVYVAGAPWCGIVPGHAVPGPSQPSPGRTATP
jgi:hypothetical protein